MLACAQLKDGRVYADAGVVIICIACTQWMQASTNIPWDAYARVCAPKRGNKRRSGRPGNERVGD